MNAKKLPAMKESCENCRFHGLDNGDVCRRHAPIAVGESERKIRGHYDSNVTEFDITDARRYWPPIKKEQWCGDYEKKEATND